MSRLKSAINLYLLDLARFLVPVFTIKGITFIFRDADVREILSRDKDFTIEEINGENIERHIGKFILGLDDGPKYQHDVNILRGVVKKEDMAGIRTYIRELSGQLSGELSGEFDIVQNYSRLIPLRLLGFYFGVPGPKDPDMLRWNRSIFWDIFLDLKNEPEIRKAALESSAQLTSYMLDLISQRKAILASGGELDDNMLNRLILLQISDSPSFSDQEIAGNLAGVFMGALEPLNKACVNALNYIFSHKKVLRKAIKAAKEDDVEMVSKIAHEALRFKPNMPLLMRYCKENQVIGGDERKKRKIKKGRTVFAMTQSAMFDPRAVKNPHRFDEERPKGTYLYYGFGQHTCFGNYINYIVIPEMIMALLKVDGLKPIDNEVVSEGPFPDRWVWKK